MFDKNFINLSFTGEPGEVFTEIDWQLSDKYFPQAILRLREIAQKFEDAVVAVETRKL